MILSKKNLSNIQQDVIKPKENTFQLPERVLQFGTGVLLRCLPDVFIDNANRQNVFNGRIVVVKSTETNNESLFHNQDNLYTVCIRGVKNGVDQNDNVISSSISRVLSARNEWGDIIRCAANPDLQIVISNTTESGIQLVNEIIEDAKPPLSFPAKLLAFLYERFKVFNGSPESGMVIIPTELISENGDKLRSIVIALANHNKLPLKFFEWLGSHNRFCNSLVDRIVPGLPNAETRAKLEKELGYQDDLLSVAEPYCLWAIQGDAYVKSVLSFASVNPEVKVVDDINIFKEIKLRLLNGTHSSSCGLAFLSGFNTVYEAMSNKTFRSFVSNLMMNDIAPFIPGGSSRTDAIEFANSVIDRFSNPHLQHKWINISSNYTNKMRERVVPILAQHYKKGDEPPKLLSIGFAGYILFTCASSEKDKKFYGQYNGQSHVIDDPSAALYFEMSGLNKNQIVEKILSNETLWGRDLTNLPGFKKAVEENVQRLEVEGVLNVLSQAIK